MARHENVHVKLFCLHLSPPATPVDRECENSGVFALQTNEAVTC